MTERKQAELLRNGQNRILEMVASNASLEDVLLELTQFAEAQLDGILVSDPASRREIADTSSRRRTKLADQLPAGDRGRTYRT